MKINRKKRGIMRLGNEKGSVLLTTFLLITVLLILGAAFVVASSNEARISEVNRKTVQAFNIAEAGIERMMYDLKGDFDIDQDWSDNEINSWTYDSTDTDADNYFPFPDASDVGNAAYVSTALGDGSYTISLKSSADDEIWVRSTGTIGSISQTIEIFAGVISLSPWDNAIFGGAGSSGAMVNGNVKIHGSVHILGNGLADGDNAIDLGGTAELVGNNYDGFDSDLEDLVPALPTVVVGADTVETLSAELRVKKGLVGLTGNSAVGAANNPGNAEKETVDGAYVTDGYNGTAGAANVFSDNGTAEAYDLGDAVSFPSLDDPYPDNPAQDYYEYFADNALVLTNELTNISPGAGNGFTYGNCASNCITMTDAGIMEIQGIVYVSADNNMAMAGSDITYTGTGTILVTGDVLLDANLLVDDAGGKGSFPANIMGIMTPGDIGIGASSQKDIMGLFYAEDTITTAKQTNLVGTIVTNYFNVSDQVPSIWQVPETSNNLPPGMLAADPVYFMKVIAWQKIDNPT